MARPEPTKADPYTIPDRYTYRAIPHGATYYISISCAAHPYGWAYSNAYAQTEWFGISAVGVVQSPRV